MKRTDSGALWLPTEALAGVATTTREDAVPMLLIVLPQLDVSEGSEAAVPGWADVRRLAPHAELRLLVCGQGTLIDAHRLRRAPQRLWIQPLTLLRHAPISTIAPPHYSRA